MNELALAVILLVIGALIGIGIYKKTIPLCQDEIGLALNQKVLCYQIGDGPIRD